jgi:hypothetical protein
MSSRQSKPGNPQSAKPSPNSGRNLDRRGHESQADQTSQKGRQLSYGTMSPLSTVVSRPTWDMDRVPPLDRTEIDSMHSGAEVGYVVAADVRSPVGRIIRPRWKQATDDAAGTEVDGEGTGFPLRTIAAACCHIGQGHGQREPLLPAAACDRVVTE